METNILVREYLEKDIEFKMIQGRVYANATSISKAFDGGSTKLKNWKRSPKTDELIKELNKINEVQNSHIGNIDLIISEKGGIAGGGSTWIHEDLLLDLAQYISTKFRIWMDEQIATLIRERTKIKSILTTLENIEFNGNMDNLVYSKNGKPITTSRIIANKFNKEHREILRAIDNKINSKNKNIVQFCTVNIKEIEYISENGQSYREYELTEQGFSFIALSLTGENADVFKIDFINSFFKIRESLTSMFKVKLLESVLPQDNRNRHYVYIIENIDNGVIKIGVGNNPESRLKQLQTGSVSELELVYRSNLCSNAFEVEKFMHDKFAYKHIRGEWYDLDKTEVINELEKCNYVLKSELIKELGLTDTMFDDIENLRTANGYEPVN